MQRRSILVVTHSGDLHADRVIELFHERAVPVFRIDLDCFPRDYRMSLQFEEQAWAGEIECERMRTSLDLRDVGAVWLRKRGAFAFAAPLAGGEKAFASEEAEHSILGWLNSLDCFFMSHPTALRAASWKLEQLKRARRLGFDLPSSLVTNLPGDARAFIGAGRSGAIYKTLSAPPVAAEEIHPDSAVSSGLHTTMIAPDDPDIDSISLLPGLFQHYVEKAYEVRVTIVAGKVLAARIDSQANERTRIDFRYFEADVGYSAIELPATLARRCCDFVASYGLSYGAIDLIATPDGRYVFLENNPVGEFLFIEALVPELEISRAVAEALIESREACRS